MKNITFASFSILWLCRGIVLASISLEIENSAIQHGYSDIDISCVVNGSALRRINRIVMKKSSINIISVSRESIVIDSQFEDQPGVVINASISDVTSAFLQLKILRTTVRFPGDIGLYQCLLFATGISGRFLMFFSRSMFLNITETAAISITSPNRILKYNETDVDVRCIVDPTFINYINNIQLKRSNENVASVSQSYGIYWQDKILENRSGVILNTSINDVTASYLHLKILGSEVKYPEDIGSYECIISAFDFKNGLIIGNSGTLRFEITGFPESTRENNVDRKLFSSAMQTSPVVFSSKDVQTTNEIEIAKATLNSEYTVLRLAFALTVPGMFILCVGVNFLCYKWGFKKGEKKFQKSQFKDTQGVHYHHYHNEEENAPLRGAGEPPGPSGGQIIIDPATHDYAAYDEIKEQRQRMIGSQRGKDGGYITPMSKDRPLPPVGPDGNGYMSPSLSAQPSKSSRPGKDSPSPPGNGGYLSPLEEQLAKHSSSNSDSSSDKSDKSRKYQNDPRSKPKTQALYESIKDSGVTQEHQYIDLHTNVVS